MRILISLINYQFLTGSELYVYELSRELKAKGHNVLVTAPLVGGEIKERTEKNGVEVYSFEECPLDWSPDVLHLNEYVPSLFALSAFPGVPAIASVHSQFSVEAPFLATRIYKYICIRPQIREKITQKDGIELERTVIIYNGIDFQRFRPTHKKNKKNVLFVGTIDPLREHAILDLIQDSRENGYKVTIVGQKHANYIEELAPDIQVHAPTWSIENYLRDATETAGILLGRTTIEGWACGLPGWIYDIDLEGNIKSKKLHKPPKDIEKFNSINVAGKIESLYQEAINNKVSIDAWIEHTELLIGISRITSDAVTSRIHINNIISSLQYLHSENTLVHSHLKALRSDVDELLEWKIRFMNKVNKLRLKKR